MLKEDQAKGRASSSNSTTVPSAARPTEPSTAPLPTLTPSPAASRPESNGSSASAPSVQPAVGHTYRHAHGPPSVPFFSVQLQVQSAPIPTNSQRALQQPEITLHAIHLGPEMHLAQYVLGLSCCVGTLIAKKHKCKCSCESRRRLCSADLLSCAGMWRSLRLGLKGCMCNWAQGCRALCPRLSWTSRTIQTSEPSSLTELLM